MFPSFHCYIRKLRLMTHSSTPVSRAIDNETNNYEKTLQLRQLVKLQFKTILFPPFSGRPLNLHVEIRC